MNNHRYRITGIKTALNADRQTLLAAVEKACGLRHGTIKSEQIEIIKRSVDARDKHNIHYTYTIDFDCSVRMPAKGRKRVVAAPDFQYTLPKPEPTALKHRPIIVGFGPCGIFAALALAEAGFRPLVIERGAAMDQRVADVEAFWQKGALKTESNVLFGEGGAGTFSDGKLTTGIKDPRIRHILHTFVAAGAPDDILYEQKPHIGTDLLRKVVVTLRKRIEATGGEIWFDTCLKKIHYEKTVENGIETNRLKSIEILHNEKSMRLDTEAMILAPGHSARDTFEMLYDHDVTLEKKPFSIGLRIEHPQAMIDLALYGDTAGLPPAAYKLNHHTVGGRGVYTFCMCPGGKVIPASNEPETLCVNGMSNRNRDSGTANAALLVDVRTTDFDAPLSGIDFQRHWERIAFENGGGNYHPPRCSWKDFKSQNTAGQNVAACLPDFAVKALREAIPVFGRKIKGFDRDDAVLTAVESRSSSPIRILRDESFNSNIRGLYPAGEGAGYAGGITSSACDGLRAAEQVIMACRPTMCK